jgi:hypothetical protein
MRIELGDLGEASTSPSIWLEFAGKEMPLETQVPPLEIAACITLDFQLFGNQ